MTLPARPVVVGVDGREHTNGALEWAVREARLRRRGVHLAHARPFPGATPYAVIEDDTRVAEHIVREAVQRVRALAPDLAVTTEIGVGRASGLLVDASREAELVVVGARGRGPARSAFLGSTSVSVAAHADCPVAVVGHLAPDGSGVVVGTDGSPRSDAALGEAFRLAELRGSPLLVVCAAGLEIQQGDVTLLDDPRLWRRLTEHQRTLAEDAAATWSAKHPDVTVEVRVVEEHPVLGIVRAAHDAELVVVGSRGRGGFEGLVLGSVSQGVLHHAPCPVVVVRHDTR